MSETTNKALQISTGIIENRLVSKNTFLLRFKAPALAAAARPGQFVKFRGWPAPAEGGGPFLDRPFSLHRIGPDGEVYLLYRVVGPGTALMGSLKPGQPARITGPLGRGLDVGRLAREHRRVYLAAGGIGVAPMVMAGEALKKAGLEVILYYGERLAASLMPPELLLPYFDGLNLCVEQEGRRPGLNISWGRPVDFLGEALTNRPGPIFGCGPLAMLAGLAELAEAHRVAYYPSLEARMACGFGVCLSCVMPRTGGGHLSVCGDGPVIEASSLDWAALKTGGGWER